MPFFVKHLVSITTIVLLSFNAQAHKQGQHDIKLSHAYTFETPPNAPVAGGYITIKNTGKKDDKLLKAEASFSGEVQIHTMSMKNDVMRMEEIKDGVNIPAGETITLQPGGKHIMFMQLEKSIKADHEYKASLYFEHAGKIDVYFAAEKMTGKTHRHSHHNKKDAHKEVMHDKHKHH